MLERLEGGNVKYVSTQVIDNVASSDSASKSNIWRVSWNATGTVLATSAENGDISLWRRNFSGEWINVQNVPSADQMQRFYPNPNWR